LLPNNTKLQVCYANSKAVTVSMLNKIQETQLLQRGRAMLLVVNKFGKSLEIIQG